MKLDKLTQPGWEDAAEYFRERDKQYGTFELRVPAVVQPQTNDDAPAPPPTTFGELMESLNIVPGISQRPQGSSRPGSSHIRLGSVKPQSKSSIPSGEPAAEPQSSRLVLATGPGNPSAVRVWTAKTRRFSSRTVQKLDPLTVGGPNPDPYPSTCRFRRVWRVPAVPISGSAFRVSYLWSHSDMLLSIVKY